MTKKQDISVITTHLWILFKQQRSEKKPDMTFTTRLTSWLCPVSSLHTPGNPYREERTDFRSYFTSQRLFRSVNSSSLLTWQNQFYVNQSKLTLETLQSFLKIDQNMYFPELMLIINVCLCHYLKKKSNFSCLITNYFVLFLLF